jgi:hypothetical protein
MPVFCPAVKRMPAALLCLPAVFALTIALLTSGCGGSAGSSSGMGSTPAPTPTPSTANEWTWMSGSSTANAQGVYGTQGVAATSNVPGARDSSVTWTDSSGNLWLFGGNTAGAINDLWEFNPTSKEWTWVSGSSTANALGVYGTMGVASNSNVPRSRYGAVGWTDRSGNLWLFGGVGDTSTGNTGLNDLWEFSPTSKAWTWMSGSSTGNAPAVYGTQGIAAPSNTPGARAGAVGWVDSSGNLWLFGGDSYTDLWEFSPTSNMWTWVSGSNTSGAAIYGAKGVAAPSNTPGARGGAVSWVDSSGNFWLFGGGAVNSGGQPTDLNDLWEFNPTSKEWMWVRGSSTANAQGVYGTLGVPATSNVPGARATSVSWTDKSGNFWLFGGYYTAGPISDFNDLWEFNPSTNEWTWVSGSNTGTSSQALPGVYGTQGVASASNVPGARDTAVGWMDNSGNFWLFGGYGFDSTGMGGDLNDLWEYQP